MPRGSTRPAHRFHTAALQLSSLAVSQALCLLLGFATHALLARSIARADYGLFSSAYSWVTLLAPYAVFGVGEWWLLEFGRRGAAARDTLRPAIALVAATTLASVAVAIVWMPAAAAGPARMLLVALIPAQALLALATSRLQIADRFHSVAGLLLLPHLLRFVVAVVVVTGPRSLHVALVGYAAAALVVSLAALLVVTRSFREEAEAFPDAGARSADARPAPARVLAVAGEAWPFAAASALYLANINVGVVIVERVAGAREAALLAVGVVLLNAIYVLPRVVFQQFLVPQMHRWAARDPERHQRAFHASRGAMGLVGLGVAALVALLAPAVLPLLFGKEYDAALPTVRLLALAVPLRFVSASYGTLLTTVRRVRAKVGCQAVGLMGGIVAMAGLVPMLGAPGAAVGLLASEALTLFLFATVAPRTAPRVLDAPLVAKNRP